LFSLRHVQQVTTFHFICAHATMIVMLQSYCSQWDGIHSAEVIQYNMFKSTVTIKIKLLTRTRQLPTTTPVCHHFTQLKETRNALKQKATGRPWTSDEYETHPVMLCVQSTNKYIVHNSFQLAIPTTMIQMFSVSTSHISLMHACMHAEFNGDMILESLIIQNGWITESH